jgi:hypothetical protein
MAAERLEPVVHMYDAMATQKKPTTPCSTVAAVAASTVYERTDATGLVGAGSVVASRTPSSGSACVAYAAPRLGCRGCWEEPADAMEEAVEGVLERGGDPRGAG